MGFYGTKTAPLSCGTEIVYFRSLPPSFSSPFSSPFSSSSPSQESLLLALGLLGSSRSLLDDLLEDCGKVEVLEGLVGGALPGALVALLGGVVDEVRDAGGLGHVGREEHVLVLEREEERERWRKRMRKKGARKKRER